MAAKTSRSRGKPDPYYSRAIGKALEAIDIITRSAAPLGLATLSRKLALTKPSTLRILRTLEIAGYLQRTPEGLYLLAPQRRTGSSQFVNRLIACAQEPMKHLNRETGETVSLAVLFDNHIEVVAVLESTNVMRMGNTVGRILQPHASSLGKAITAYQPEELREKLLHSYGIHRFTTKTLTGDAEIRRELGHTRVRGYAVDNEETVDGGRCFGAPVFGPAGEVMAAVSMSMPISRAAGQNEQRLVQTVRRAAAAIAEAVRAPRASSRNSKAMRGPTRKARPAPAVVHSRHA